MKNLIIFCLILCMLILPSCSSELYVSKTFWAMDTYIDIKLPSNLNNCDDIFGDCDAKINDIEKLISKSIEDSDVSKFNLNLEVIEINDITRYIIETAAEVSDLTDGAFDITLLSVSEYWQECANAGNFPNDEELSRILSYCGQEKINLSGNCLSKSNSLLKIDLGGIGKGYASDVLVEYFNNCDVDYGMVSFGSNVAVWGEKPDGSKYKIGIKDPMNTNSLIGYINMSEGVLSVSGDYERYVEIDGQKYHHITDPSTGYPTNNGVHSIAVICDKGIYSDALSTAFMVMGVEKTMELYNSGKIEFEVLFVTDDGITMSTGMKEIFDPIE